MSLEGHDGTVAVTFTRLTPSPAGRWEWDVPALGFHGRGAVYATQDTPTRLSLVFEPDAALICTDGSRWTNFLADLVREANEFVGSWYRFVSPCRQGALRLRRRGG